MLIEATNVSNLSLARYFAAWNIDFMSFQFDPEHPLFIHPSNALEIKNWLSGPKYGGVFNAHELPEIQDVIAMLDLTYVRLPFHRKELASQIDINTIISCSVEEYDQIKDAADQSIHGLDVVGDWSDLKHLNTKKTFLNPISLTAEITKEIIDFNPDGLILNGWNELEVGLADFDEMDEVQEVLNRSIH